MKEIEEKVRIRRKIEEEVREEEGKKGSKALEEFRETPSEITGLEELKIPFFSLIKTPSFEPKLLSSKINFPKPLPELYLEIPFFPQEKALELRPITLSAEIKLPSAEELPLIVPLFEFRPSHPLKPSVLKETFLLPKAEELLLYVPSFRLSPPQILRTQRLEEKVKLTLGLISSQRQEEAIKTEVGTLSSGGSIVEEEEVKLEDILFELPLRGMAGDLSFPIKGQTVVCCFGFKEGLFKESLEVVKGLIELEVEDRGKKPSFKPLRKGNVPKSGVEKEEYLLERQRDFAILLLSGWKDLAEVENDQELLDFLQTRKGFNCIILDLKEQAPPLLTEDEKRLRAVLKVDRAFILTPKEVKDPEKLLEAFSRILNTSRKEVKASDLSSIAPDITLDRLWHLARGEKPFSAVRDLINDLYPEFLERGIFKPQEEHESSEHFAMKLLAAHHLLQAGFIIELEKVVKGEEGEWEKEEELEVEKRFRRIDVWAKKENKEIWVECETLKNKKDPNPLEILKDKLRDEIIPSLIHLSPPAELWFVVPYRKAVIYGRKLFEPLELLRNIKSLQGMKSKLFLADLRNKKLLRIGG